jgi:hypothetical protein
MWILISLILSIIKGIKNSDIEEVAMTDWILIKFIFYFEIVEIMQIL